LDITVSYLKAELERLDLMHGLFALINDNKLHLAPIGASPQRILDVGAGTGVWWIEMGDLYPSAEIIGIDLSGDMPAFVPPNVKFEIDDAEEPWTFSQLFDYIHTRYMTGGIKDWPAYIEQCFK